MKAFMGKDFLLSNPTAVHLYHDYAKNMPIIDYHCHISPKEIYEDIHFENIAQIWLGGHKVIDGKNTYAGDHYKWRLMRANGVEEKYILGDEDDYDRFYKFCETLEKCIGNPMVHWCQLELNQYFGITKPINTKNAQEIWNTCNEKIKNDPSCTARGFIKTSNVALVGTTDDPIDSLEYHHKIKNDPTFDVLVVPSFRPDKALNIQAPTYVDYINQLAKVANKEIHSLDDLVKALEVRLDYFKDAGCRASDHGLEAVLESEYDYDKANEAFLKAMDGSNVTEEQKANYQMYVLVELGKMYYEREIVMQIHYNALRNTNQKQYEDYGVDTGYDAMDMHNCIHGIQNLLSYLSYTDQCPKTVLYSLNPSDMDAVAVIAGCFQTNSKVASRIQLGAPWWFNDTKDGMEKQLKTLGRLGTLGNFIGMLTDSRSFLSYTRHEYFRRILCNVIGTWVENGEFYNDEALLREIIEGICYNNGKVYFNL